MHNNKITKKEKYENKFMYILAKILLCVVGISLFCIGIYGYLLHNEIQDTYIFFIIIGSFFLFLQMFL